MNTFLVQLPHRKGFGLCRIAAVIAACLLWMLGSMEHARAQDSADIFNLTWSGGSGSGAGSNCLANNGYVNPNNPPYPYQWTAFGAYPSNTTGTASGPMSATATLKSGQTAPQAVIVVNNYAAVADNDTSKAKTKTGSTTPAGTQNGSEITYLGTLYTGYSNNGSTFTTIPSSCFAIPSFSATSTLNTTDTQAQANVSASCQAEVYPISITLDGPDSNNNIYIGQQCSARLYGLPLGLPQSWCTYTWTVHSNSVSGWNPAVDSSTDPNKTPVDLSDPTNPKWYWVGAAVRTYVQCVIQVTPPQGQGSQFSLTLHSNYVNVKRPQSNVNTVPAPNCSINQGIPKYPLTLYFYAGVASYDATAKTYNPNKFEGGINWGYIAGPQAGPAMGTKTDSLGTCGIFQLISGSYSWTPVMPTPAKPNKALDVMYPVSSADADNASHSGNDSPGVPLQDSWTDVGMNLTFNDYFMFRPDKLSSNCIWVPLRIGGWNVAFSKNVKQPSSGHWSDWDPNMSAGGTISKTDFTQEIYTQFPSWTTVFTDPTVQ